MSGKIIAKYLSKENLICDVSVYIDGKEQEEKIGQNEVKEYNIDKDCEIYGYMWGMKTDVVSAFADNITEIVFEYKRKKFKITNVIKTPIFSIKERTTTEKTIIENGNVDTTESIEHIDNSTNKTVLDYNESYCELVKHILLSLLTFGIWMYIWIYKTTKALNKTPDSEKYDPTKKLLLCMFVPFYTIYWFYKHGEKIDKLNATTGKKTDNTSMYLLLGIFIPVVACILMQENINKLCVADAYVAPATNSEASVKGEKNVAEALKEYKSLLDIGAITQEEFDEKKKQLLNL